MKRPKTRRRQKRSLDLEFASADKTITDAMQKAIDRELSALLLRLGDGSRLSVQPSALDRQEIFQKEWTAALNARIQAIQRCIKRGGHATKNSEGRHLGNGRLLVMLECECGAQARVVIEHDKKPPQEWT